MQVDLFYSEELFREYIYKKVVANRIVLVIVIALYLLLAYANKNGFGLEAVGNVFLTNATLLTVAIMFAFGMAGFFVSYAERKQTENAQLCIEGNTVTYMCRSKVRYFNDGSLRGWHMKKVASVEEKRIYYLVKGEGVYIDDTRFMNEQKIITQVKIPKWFIGMEKLKAVPQTK